MSKKKLILVIGPESTGTRIFTRLFSQHPDVLGTVDAPKHVDILDDVWQYLESNDLEKASEIMPNFSEQCLLSRRSVPHSAGVGISAEFMSLPAMENLLRLANKLDLELIVFITTRNPAPNIISMSHERASVAGKFAKAEKQYRHSLNAIYGFVAENELRSFTLSLEGLVLDGAALIRSTLMLLGLPDFEVDFDPKLDVNARRYDKFFSGELNKPLLERVKSKIAKFIK